jgi:uncharacterized membrane protein
MGMIILIIILTALGVLITLFSPKDGHLKDILSFILILLATFIGVYLAFYLTKGDTERDTHDKTIRILELGKKDFNNFSDTLNHSIDSLGHAEPAPLDKSFAYAVEDRLPEIFTFLASDRTSLYNLSEENVLGFEHNKKEFQNDIGRMKKADTKQDLQKAVGLFFQRVHEMQNRLEWEIQFQNNKLNTTNLETNVNLSESRLKHIYDSLYSR